MEAQDERQVQYETRRRTRVLGLGMDQSLHGMKNIIVFSDPRYWPDEDKDRWSHIRTQAENLLVLMTDLEQKLSAMAPIYQSFVPISPEVTTTPVEMQLEPAKPDITSSGQ